MEKENFDEELKNRIKQVFEEYDDGAANKGWNLLREKYPEKKRDKYFFWWAGLAALFLVALLFGLFLSGNLKNNHLKLVKQPKKDFVSTSGQTASAHKNYAPVQNSPAKKPLHYPVRTSIAHTKKTSVKTASPLIANRLPQQQNTEQAAVEPVNTKKTPVKTVWPLLAQTVKDRPEKTNRQTTKPENQPKTATQNNTVFTGIKKGSVADSILKTAPVRPAALSDSSQKKQPQLLVKTTNPATTKSPIVKKAAPIKKLSGKLSKFGFGLFAGAHLNYAKGSNNQLGLGAGWSVDFRIGKNLKLVSGLGLMQNKLRYSQGVSASTQSAATSYSAPQPVQATTSVQTSNISSMDASLLALDIPVNLAYTFLPGKNSISVSAGLSSTTFATEVYDYHYNVFTAAATAGGVAAASTQNLQERKNFNSFNFAKTLNLAIGFAYPLGKNKLLVEPFLKYPLGGMGLQQLKFGSAGINFRINLTSYKK